MSISIIIPTYNEEKYLARTLESIKNQSFKKYEIIVVCNGCIDKSFSIAKKHADKIFNLKEQNVSKAKNLGADNAKYDNLIFLDADTLLFSGVLKCVDETLSKGNFFGTCKGRGSGFTNNLYFRFKNLVNKFEPWSHGFVFCNRKNFLEINGFNENLKHGELKDFFKRINGKYKRINTYVETNDRRIKSWGLLKSASYWLFKKDKEEYGAIR